MITSHNGDELRTYNKTITSSAKELWIKAIDEGIESMRSNHIGARP